MQDTHLQAPTPPLHQIQPNKKSLIYGCGSLQLFFLYYCFCFSSQFSRLDKRFKNKNYGTGSAIKRTCCLYRKPWFSSQYPNWVFLSGLYQGIQCPLLAPAHTATYTHRQIFKNLKIRSMPRVNSKPLTSLRYHRS